MIPLAKPYFDHDELLEVEKVLYSGMVSGRVPAVREFEEKVQAYLGVKYAVAVTNCTVALHLALLVLGIKEGDEVIVPAFSYPATSHAVVYCGAKPVFVDIDLETFNIDPSEIESKITAKTRAIIPVHLFGQMAEVEYLCGIAHVHDLYIIEDAACSFGAEYMEYKAGTIGDLGCFSFHARKGITTGEGGMLVTNDSKKAAQARKLTNFGIKDLEQKVAVFDQLGYNYKMSGITAAIGIAQLRKLEMIIQRKRNLAAYWNEQLAEIPLVKTLASAPGHVYQAYVVLLENEETRDKAIKKLTKEGIGSQIGTYACHIQPVYRSKAWCPNAIEAYERSLALPMYYKLREKDIDKIVDVLKGIL